MKKYPVKTRALAQLASRVHCTAILIFYWGPFDEMLSAAQGTHEHCQYAAPYAAVEQASEDEDVVLRARLGRT